MEGRVGLSNRSRKREAHIYNFPELGFVVKEQRPRHVHDIKYNVVWFSGGVPIMTTHPAKAVEPVIDILYSHA